MRIHDRFSAYATNWQNFKEILRRQKAFEARAKPLSDHEFLPAALEIIEKPPSPGWRYLMLSLCAFVFLTLTWSFFGKIDVIASANGKVVPAGSVKAIQPIELGYVRAIYVKNGQRVKAGELLIELDSTLTKADVDKATQSLAAAEVITARNAALLEHLQGRRARLRLPYGTPADVTVTQKNLLGMSIAEYEGERKSLLQQRAELEAELASAQAEITKLTQTLPLVEKQLEAREQLASKGYFSKIRLLEYQQLKVEHIQNIEVQRAKVAGVSASIGNIDAQLMKLKGNFSKSTIMELFQAQENAKFAREEVTKTVRRKQYQQLRAPVSGIVQELNIFNTGAIVQPAQVMMIIVPDQVEPQVKAAILNKDIGFVREGQKVKVKIDAFNFIEFGFINGVVDSISADAIQVQQNSNYKLTDENLIYNAYIRLNSHNIYANGLKNKIKPGLSVRVEIKTGERRIIDYFLSPVIKSLDEYGKER